MTFQSPTYRLVWPDGHRLHGLVIRMRGMTAQELGTLVSANSALLGQDDPRADATAVEYAGNMAMIELFSRRLIEWNYLDEDGAALGTSVDEVCKADLGVVMQAIGAWQKEVTRVPDPLPEGSSNGRQYPAPFVPTDLPSPSLPS